MSHGEEVDVPDGPGQGEGCGDQGRAQCLPFAPGARDLAPDVRGVIEWPDGSPAQPRLNIYDGVPRMTEAIDAFQQAGFYVTGMFPVSRELETGRVLEFDCVMVRPGLRVQ